uniref:U1 small nuclear ribonucleoprotein 70 kDa n=1 Tax=Globodera rostochiensis TaxID=31243 RepID=A0A914I3I4_GLORO
MTQFLPDNLLALFAPRPPIQYKPPADDLFINRKHMDIGGIAEFVHGFEDPKDIPPKPQIETREEKRGRKRKEKEELMAYKIEQGIATWTPADNPKATLDPYKTLFIGRINYETSESKIRREFEKYGKISKIVMVHDKNSKPRGYAFIEFAHKSEMSASAGSNERGLLDRTTQRDTLNPAYKKADGTKIDGRRVVVDYERGRTQKKWLPRRLGGGKGDTRRARESKATLLARELAEEAASTMANGSSSRSFSPYRSGGGGGGGGSGSNSSSRRRSRSRSRERSSRRSRSRDRRR